MFKRTSVILFFILLHSCSLFKSRTDLKTSSLNKNLEAIRLEGEGKGRLGIEPQNYLFSFDALLKQDDWILAVTVPLHGEEAMILRGMRHAEPPLASSESFEARIIHELKSRRNLRKLKPSAFITHTRSMMRFIFAPKLGLERACQETSQEEFLCSLGEENFQIKLHSGKIIIKKSISSEHGLELAAENLTDSFFSRTNFYLRERSFKTETLMSLELFWK